jgi:hypothetical protein
MTRKTAYSGIYDSSYNVETAEWLEPKCGQENCMFCSKRPKTAKGLKGR